MKETRTNENNEPYTVNVDEIRVTCLGEIVKASGFQAENLYVTFNTFVPEGWRFEDANEYEVYRPVRDDYAEDNKR